MNPKPEAGFVCFYRGGTTGAEQKEDENVAFFGFSDAQGNIQGEEGKEGIESGRDASLPHNRTGVCRRLQTSRSWLRAK